MTDTSINPLQGLKVVSLEQAVAAPLCSRRLVLAGAEVFKIERPEGDFARYYDTAVAGESAYFVWLNAGKKSVVLDLRSATDRTALLKLIALCDVLIANLKPGALASLGIDLAALRKADPRLITVAIAGFHPAGPGRERKAYDLLMQAESGLADITGSPHAPGRVGVSLVDLATGMFTYEAILEALLMRAISGSGTHIDVALFDAVAEWMTVPYLLSQHTGVAPERVGLAHPGICPYGVFTTRDHTRLVLSIQNEREWARLCGTALQDEALMRDERCVDNATRVAHRAFVDGRVQDGLAKLTYAAASARLNDAGIAFAPVSTVADLARHPDLRTQSIRLGAAQVQLPAVPGLNKPSDLKVPALGEHTNEVLDWLESLAD
jgi:crotonobetainyl-CoA:carnitine CoA-transferase CaiB-like acyl-CoA transferase